ncbi:cation/H(+) antiporter 24-like [Cucurbita moschata]|uniref:Cation/H(+) antiporter 24-like n=1 Tax=Cucurbita moschata TaxID=3662 RepID=A0A6J1G950_CUCMO|nr:cation/H(+) antiporter 24-like [Cucurbita moschata]
MVRFFHLPSRFAQYDNWRNFSALDLRHIQRLHVVGGLTSFKDATPAATAPVACRLNHPRTPGIFYGANPLDDSFSALILDISFVILLIHIIHLLLRPFHQPKIVSQVLGGFIIGPSVLSHNKNFRQQMFSEDISFLLSNVGLIGFMYFLFISGVKTDLSLTKKSGKKEFFIASFSVIVPLILNITFALLIRKTMNKSLAKFSSIGAITSSLAITAFPVVHPILHELNLLSSEVGRMSMSVSIISDAVGINALVAFEAAIQGEVEWKSSIWYLISLIVLVGFIVVCVRRVMRWIVRRTPEGQAVEQGFIVAILLAVLVMGFLTDLFGIAILNGPLWLGMAIPDGPPLGSTLVERSETIISELLLPFSFAFVGLCTDVFQMVNAGWSNLAPLFFLALAGHFFKFGSTLVASLFFQLPLRDSLAVSLIMCLRGQVEIVLLIHWIDKKIITIPEFTMMILMTVAVTGIATPLISLLYDPTRPYMINKRRTIQHLPPGKELRVVLCIEGQENVAALVNLLDMSNPTTSSPFSIYALHLIELVGRAAPVFIDHKKCKTPSKYTASDSIHNALRIYEEARGELVKLHTYTAVAPKRSMNQDICELALIKKTNLIVLPFGRTSTGDSTVGLHPVNKSVLEHAPCSVGILVDKCNLHSPVVGQSFWNSAQQFAVLFLGGADAREALAYADRILGNQDVCVSVVRFLSHNSRGDNELEKKLDDGMVTWFWVKNETNERVIYREVVVRNGAETIAAIQSMNDDSYDLVIVGRKRGVNPVLLEGLSNWSQDNELGIIGDYVSSEDFGAAASVLVVQQQVLRGQSHFSSGICGKFRFDFR